MRKFILSGIILILGLCFMVGCGGNRYNAVVSSYVNNEISAEFLKENRVKAYYHNEEADDIIFDSDSPDNRTFIITEKEEFNRIFTNTDLTVDFEKEMILLYIFGDIYPAREYYLNKISLYGQTLNIKMKLENREGKDSVMLFQRCLTVKLDKIDINAVNIEINRH